MLLYTAALAIGHLRVAIVINARAFLWGSVIVLTLAFMTRLVQFHRRPTHHTRQSRPLLHHLFTRLFTAVAVEGLLG